MDRRSFVLAAAGGSVLTLDWQPRARPRDCRAGAIEAGALEAPPGKVPLDHGARYVRRTTKRRSICSTVRSRRTVRSSCAGTSPTFPRSMSRSGGSRSAALPRARAAEYSLDDLKKRLRDRRARRGVPMQRQPARAFGSARPGRRMGLRRGRQRALERRAPARRARQGRRQEGSDRDRLRRRRPRRPASDAGLPEEHSRCGKRWTRTRCSPGR